VAALLLGARVVSGPGVYDHDLVRDGDKIEVKASLAGSRTIGNLAGKVRDRVAYVQLAVCEGRLHVIACSFYENSDQKLGRRPGRTGFLSNPKTKPIRLERPIRLPWRLAEA
jgi:hypothetical protein